ncbi:MAG: cation-efflux pump, partial [Mesorhizobium sp.]
MTEARDTTTAAAKAATRQKVARLAFWSIVVAFAVLALK